MITRVTAGDGSKKPLVLAHRGARREEPENTIPAFTRALRQGADGIELDVHRTSDNSLVVHHDADTPELGVLANLTVKEIKLSRPDIPTLEEVFTACKNCLINVEIKNIPTDADYDESNKTADLVVDLISALDRQDDVIISSFNMSSINQVLKLAPSMATGFLVSPIFDFVSALTLCQDNGHGAIHPFMSMLAFDEGVEFINASHQFGIDVNVWTANEVSDIEYLISIGVDSIITDVPDTAIKIRDSLSS